MKKTGVILAVLLLAAAGAFDSAAAANLETYAKAGTIQLLDHGKNFNHRAAVAAGADISDGDRIVVWRINPEIWRKMDTANHTPDMGFRIFATLGRKFVYGKFQFTPYVGINPGYWRRDLDGNFHVSGQNNQNWREMYYLFFPAGARSDYGIFYADFGLLFPGPWKSNLDSAFPPFGGKNFRGPHLYGEMGLYILKRAVRIGLFFDKTSFDEPNTNIHTQGLRLGYRF